MLIKNEIINLSKLIKNNDLDQAFQLLDKMIEFKSTYPNCCSNCAGHGFKGSTGCKKDSYQSWNTRLNDFKGFLISHASTQSDCKMQPGNIKSWAVRLNDFKTFLNDFKKGSIDASYKLPFSVFKSGNGKHKFMNYSTIPIVNCPGAGSCASDKFCYSLKSLMRPNAALSWLQNQILEDNYFNIIELEFEKHLKKNYKKHLKNNLNIDFRLYNDGDFSSLNNMVLWFNLLKKYPQIKAYGYTKSLHLVKELSLMDYEFPANYKFNISSGSKYEYLKNDKVIKNNPSYRGNFISFDLNGFRVNTTKRTKEHDKTLRNAFKKKIFICPGTCNTCTSIGHACGSEKFNNIDIVIPIH